MSEYLEYVFYNRDDNPLYLFEAGIEDHSTAHALQKDYTQPKFFSENFCNNRAFRIFIIM